MKLGARIRRFFGGESKRSEALRAHALEVAQKRYLQIKARWDAASHTADFEKHWAHTDALSPARAVDPVTRARLRERARYEVLENNSYGLGIVLSKANDVIGTGAKLRALTKDKKANRRLQSSFANWAREVNLAQKLQTAYMTKVVAGEAFILPVTNPNLSHPVKLDLRLIEPEQVAHPTFHPSGAGLNDFDPLTTDGVHYDTYGNVTAYDVLKEHPGSIQQFSADQYDTVAARDIIHMFRRDRPGQPRGISEVAPALPLFALLRRFTLATLIAAEVAADFAAVVETDGSATDDEGATFAPLAPEEIIEIDRGAMVSLPWGWRMQQLRAEHPTTTYEMFHDAILTEIARCVQVPFNRAAGKSVQYTFASGKLDRDSYLDHIDHERHQINVVAMDHILRWWWNEAALVPGGIPRGIGPLVSLSYQWFWDRHREADPQKQAAADVTYWRAGLLLDEEFWLSRGLDPDEQYAKLDEQTRRRAAMQAPQPGGTTDTQLERPTETAGQQDVDTSGVLNEATQGE